MWRRTLADLNWCQISHWPHKCPRLIQGYENHQNVLNTMFKWIILDELFKKNLEKCEEIFKTVFCFEIPQDFKLLTVFIFSQYSQHLNLFSCVLDDLENKYFRNFQKSIFWAMPDPHYFVRHSGVRGGGRPIGTPTTTCLTFSGTRRGGVLCAITRPVTGCTHPI